MSERFTEILRAASEPGWSHAVGHRFVKELYTGTLLRNTIDTDHYPLSRRLQLWKGILAKIRPEPPKGVSRSRRAGTETRTRRARQNVLPRSHRRFSAVARLI